MELYFDIIFLVTLALTVVSTKYKAVTFLLLAVIFVEFSLVSLFNTLAAAFDDKSSSLFAEEEFCVDNGISIDNSYADYYTAFYPSGWIKDGKFFHPKHIEFEECFKYANILVGV